MTAISDTSVTLNTVDVPRELWNILEQWGSLQRLSANQSFWIFMLKTLTAIKKRNPAFEEITAACHMGREKAMADEEDRSDPQAVKARDLPPVESYYDLLETNDKAASGFVGVYQNGKAFRASAPRPDGRGSRNAVNVGTYETPDQAALARLLYYRKHKLIYGRHAFEITRHQQMLHEMGRTDTTFEEALESLNEAREMRGQVRIEIADNWLLYIGERPTALLELPSDDGADAASS